MPSERCVRARRLRATGDPLEFVQTTDPLRLTLFKSARIRAPVYQDAGTGDLLGRRAIIWAGAVFLAKPGRAGDLVPGQPCAGSGTALVGCNA